MTTNTADLAAAREHTSVGAYCTRAAITLAPPWVTAAAGWGAGALTNVALSHNPWLPAITPAMALAGATLTVVAWRSAPSRATLTRFHSATTVALGTLWECACAISPPWSPMLATISGIGGAAVALSWNIRRLMRLSDHEGQQQPGLFDSVRLAGVQMRRALVEPNRVEAQLQLPPGPMTVADVQGAAPLVDKTLGLRPGSTRVSPDPDHAGRATMTIVPEDVLTTPLPWTGPSRMGGSIAEPIVLGTHEDQQPMALILPGDRATQRISVHMAVTGQSGAGKSHGAEVAWVEIGTRYDVVPIILDPVKGSQSLGLVEGLLHTVDGQQDCARVWSAIPVLISEQADRLGKAGFKEWEPAAWTKHGIPYFVVWVEEATKVLGDEKSTIDILQAARSAGISIVLSMQRPSYRQINTDARAQLNTVWCFGVQDIEDAAFVLPDEAIEAGVRPDQWGAKLPGCSYLVWGGVAETRWPVPGRTPATATPPMRAVLAAYRHRPAMPAYAAQILGLPPRPGGHTPTTTGTPPARQAPSRADDLDDMPIPDDVDQQVELPEDPEPDLEGDADTELPDDPDMPLPGGQPSRTEALRMLHAAVHTLAGRDFTVRDLPADLETRLGRSRPWVSGELAKLADEGVLAEVGADGKATVYRVAE